MSQVRFVAQDKAGLDSTIWNHIVTSQPETIYMSYDDCWVSGFSGEIETACGRRFKPVAQHLWVFPTHHLAGLCPSCVSEQ